MTDREMLELAARAAGIPAYWSDDGTIQCRPVLVVKAGGGMGTMPYEQPWNPLTDDGDALRLAVKLRIGFIASTEQQPDHAIVLYQIGEVPYRSVAGHNGDELAATRRAITRAAAEIGKAMP